MNAPFNASRAAALRDPFSAFVCDDATAEMLRPIAVEHGWAPEKVNKGGLRNAVQTLSVSASPAILFVDLSESGDPLNDINALAEVCEPGTVVIAAGQVNDVRLYRDLRRVGPSGLSAQAVHARPAARQLRQCPDDHLRPPGERGGEREAARHGGRDRRSRRSRSLDRSPRRWPG